MTTSTIIADALLADFDAECHHTKRVLAAVPEDRLAWQPHAKSMSLGKLASHVAEIPKLAPILLEPEFTSGALGKWKPFAAQNQRELLEGFERFAVDARQALRSCNDDAMQATWRLRRGDEVIWTCPRHVAMRTMLIHHWIHHRGQLTVYLRLLDVPVPATYGPSADVAV